MTGQVLILLASYEGAAFLPAQLQSYQEQTYQDWALHISDDGSKDGSLEILQGFAATTPQMVQIRQGPGQGAPQNFLSLLAETPDRSWIALSDQDDVWFEGKLARALETLKALPNAGPALYCATTQVTDQDLQIQHLSPLPARTPDFRNALLQNIASGNTIMLNPAAAHLVRTSAKRVLEQGLHVPFHDWWIYQLITGAGGTVLFDAKPCLLYRQHPGNVVGANQGWAARFRRMVGLFGGQYQNWLTANLIALNINADLLTPQNRTHVTELTDLRQAPLLRRMSRFHKLGLYRQRLPQQLAIWLALILGRM